MSKNLFIFLFISQITCAIPPKTQQSPLYKYFISQLSEKLKTNTITLKNEGVITFHIDASNQVFNLRTNLKSKSKAHQLIIDAFLNLPKMNPIQFEKYWSTLSENNKPIITIFNNEINNLKR